MSKEKKDTITMSVVIVIMVLLLIFVVVIIYLGAVYGPIGMRINNTLDDLQKKFGKLTTALGEIGDEIADGLKDVVVPALKQIGPEVKDVVTSSVNLVKGYLTLGKNLIDKKASEIQSEVQSMGMQQPIQYQSQSIQQTKYQPVC